MALCFKAKKESRVVVLLCVLYFVQFCESAQIVAAKSVGKNSPENATALDGPRDLSRKFKPDKRFFHHGKMLIPILLGGLLKVAATIPLLLAVATVIGTVSLLTSKVSLIISAILGARTVYSLFFPARKSEAILSKDDMLDLQQLMSKVAPGVYSHPTESPTPFTPPMPQKLKMQELMNAVHQQQATKEMMYYNDLYHRQNEHENLYYPENYFNPSAVTLEQFDAMKTNQMMEEAARIAGAHSAAKLQSRADSQRSTIYGDSQSAKQLAVQQMAQRASSLLERQAMENPNELSAVKITKTVVNHGED